MLIELLLQCMQIMSKPTKKSFMGGEFTANSTIGISMVDSDLLSFHLA